MTASNAFTDSSQGEPADVSRGDIYQRLPKSGIWQVFISHTSEFAEYPVEQSYIRRVEEWVLRAKHNPHHMKLFPAVAEPASIFDVNEVRDSDVYVGIHGMRWGSPLPDQPEMSHVEQEYETAKRIGIPRLLFLLDENSSEHCLPEEKPMDAMYAERQKTFRERLKTEDGNIISSFSSPDDLKAKLYHGLKVLEELAGYCRWSWPKPWDFSGYRESKRNDFVGREWLFNEVRRWVNGDDNPSSGTQALLIGADYGVGKSAFLAQLVDTRTEDIPVVAHYFCQADEEETLNPAVFVCSIASQLADALPAYRQAIEAESAKDLRRRLDEINPKSAGSTFDQSVLAPLRTIPRPPKPMLLVVDALDESLDLRSVNTNVDSPTIVKLLATFANRMPPWLKLLATSRPRNDVLEKLGQAFTLKPLNPISNIEDLEHYCKHRCDREPLKAKIEAAGLSTSSVATFLSRQEQSGGKFLYVSLVLSDLESQESYSLQLDHPDDLKRLPADLASFYSETFERRFPTDESYAFSRSILGILCEIREPIGMNELTAILKRSEQEIGTSLKILQDLLRLQPVAQVADGGSMNELLYSFGHVSLMQWLNEKDEHRTHRAGRFAVNRSEANKQLMEWAILEADSNHAHASEYLVRHLESHIPIDRIQPLLIQRLRCFRWLEAKARITGISSLLQDYERLERPTAETSKLEQILRQSFHILNNNGEDWDGSRQLASQLLARINAQWASPFWDQFRATCQDWLRSNQLPRPLWPSLQSDESLIQTYSFPKPDTSITSCFKDLVAVGYGEKSIDILDTRTLSITSHPIRLNTKVTAVTAFLDGRLVLGCEDGRLYFCAELEELGCDYMPVAPKFALRSPIRDLRCINEKGLVILAGDGSLHYYDLNSKTHVELQNKSKRVTAFTVLRDGHIIVANRLGEVYRILPFISSTCLIEKDPKPPTVTSILELADDRLAFGCYDGSIKVFNPETTIPVTQTRITAHKEHVTTLCLLGIDRLISGSSNGMIGIWEIASMRCIQILDGHSAGSSISCLLPLNESTILSGSADGTLKVWRLEAERYQEDKTAGHGFISSAAAFDDKTIVYSTARPSIHLYALNSDQCFGFNQSQRASSLAIRSDGYLAVGSDDGQIQVWSVASQELKFYFEFHGHSDQIQALTFLPNGNLVSGSDDTKIRIWRISSDAADCIHTLHGHNEWIRSLLVLADGRLASASDDRTTPIRIWDPEGGNQPVFLAGISGPVRALAALTGNSLAIASNDSFLALYDLPNLEMQAECTFSANEPFFFELKSRWRCDFRAFSGLKISSLIYIEKYKLLCGSAGRIIFTYCPDNIASHPSIAFVSDHEISTLVHVPMTSTIIAGDKSGRLHWIDLST